MIKVLQIMPTMGHGGIAMMMKMYAEELSKYGVVFDFLHHGKEEKFHDDLKNYGSRFFSLPSLTQIGSKEYYSFLKKIVDENGPYNAVHINMNYQSGRYAAFVKKVGINNRIVHVHGINFYRSCIKYFMPLIRLDIKHNATCLCADSSQCGDFYYKRSEYQVIPVAIDTSIYENVQNERSRMRGVLGLTGNDFAIGHIAAFYDVKNHFFDVELLKKLLTREKSRNYKMFFAGDGPLKTDVKKAFEDAGIVDHVIFLGNIDYIPAYLSAMDLTILPSKSEGLGQVLIQSQAVGVPCIASDTLPRESDMHIGLASYLPIEGEDAVSTWCDKIESISYDRLPFDKCKSGIDVAGYSISVAAKKLLQCYMGE